MLKAFIRSWIGWLTLGVELLSALPAEGWSAVPKRLLLFTLGWFLFGLLNAMHWLGFLFDEIFFSGYRTVRILRPISIVGIPRSGTTYLQRVLANDQRFTTLTLWECVFAPSITERFLVAGIGRLSGLIRLPRLINRSRFLARMDTIHQLGMSEPEEDFLLLLWVHACFLAVIACPGSDRFWRLARFDEDIPAADRHAVMHFYHRCLQKHLYYHGADRRLLSKNPSFTPMLASLRGQFPDAVVVACVREPFRTVPSQLSSLLPAFALVGRGTLSDDFQRRMIGALRDYYGDIARFASEDDLHIVEMARLNAELDEVVAEIFTLAGHGPSAEFGEALAALASEGRNYASAHRYTLASFDLTEDQIRRSFDGVWPLSLPSANDG